MACKCNCAGGVGCWHTKFIKGVYATAGSKWFITEVCCGCGLRMVRPVDSPKLAGKVREEHGEYHPWLKEVLK